MTARTQFGLNELSPDSFKKITNSVNASGSNKNIATIVWYNYYFGTQKNV